MTASPSMKGVRPWHGFTRAVPGALSLQQQEVILGWTLLAPALAVMAVLVIWPFFTAFWMAFTDKAIGRDAAWVGLANFAEVASSPRFLRSLYNSLVFTVASVAIKFVLGMAMALVLNQGFRGRNVLRAFFLIPWVLPAFVGYMIWRSLYDPLQGLLNYALLDLGLSHYPLEFLSSPATAMRPSSWRTSGAASRSMAWPSWPVSRTSPPSNMRRPPSMAPTPSTASAMSLCRGCAT